MLQMLERNKKIKAWPERFQDTDKQFDVIITCEERCYDIVCEGLKGKYYTFIFLLWWSLWWLELVNSNKNDNKAVYVVNFDIKDNHEDATIGGRSILQLAQSVQKITLFYILLSLSLSMIYILLVSSWRKVKTWIQNSRKLLPSFRKNLLFLSYIVFVFTNLKYLLTNN
jgi:Ssu72-like protein